MEAGKIEASVHLLFHCRGVVAVNDLLSEVLETGLHIAFVCSISLTVRQWTIRRRHKNSFGHDSGGQVTSIDINRRKEMGLQDGGWCSVQSSLRLRTSLIRTATPYRWEATAADRILCHLQ